MPRKAGLSILNRTIGQPLELGDYNTEPFGSGSATQQPLAGGSFSNWLRLLWDNGGVDMRYLPRALFVTTATLACAPFRLFEQLRFGKTLANTEIKHPPVFIIGHWRSGTTHLHNVLTQDPNFGFVTTFQAIAPGFSLAGKAALRPLLRLRVPRKRYMDNMDLSLDLPQEEEVALANLSRHSFYHYWSFPRSIDHYLRTGLFLDGVSDGVRAEWKAAYLHILKKATFTMQGRRLVVKNPANTGRIRLLLELLPDAKFIHIYRNPYDVFLSTRYFHWRILAIAALQDVTPEAVESNVLRIYKELMERFFAEKDLIPKGNYTELRFEDFETRPLPEIERIYSELNLPGFHEAAARFRSYLASQNDYQKNEFPPDDDAIRKVRRHWAFTIERWGYAAPIAAAAQ